MLTMENLDTLQLLKQVLAELKSLLQREGAYDEFSYMIRRYQRLAEAAETDPGAVQLLKEYLLTQPTGPGTFFDLVLSGPSYTREKFVEVNDQLDQLRSKLLELAEQL